MSKLHPEVKNALDKLEQDIAEAVESNRELNKKYFLLEGANKKLTERLTATTGLLRSLLLNKAVPIGMDGKLRKCVNLNEQELKPKS